jgi:hypothetical protein
MRAWARCAARTAAQQVLAPLQRDRRQGRALRRYIEYAQTRARARTRAPARAHTNARAPGAFYWANVVTHDALAAALCALIALGTTLAALMPLSAAPSDALRRALLRTVSVTVAAFAVHSLVPRHMEARRRRRDLSAAVAPRRHRVATQVRFVHDVIVTYVLAACLAALALARALRPMVGSTSPAHADGARRWSRPGVRYATAAVAAAVAVGMALAGHGASEYYSCRWATSPRSSAAVAHGQSAAVAHGHAPAAWSDKHHELAQALLPALAHAGAQADVAGIIIDGFDEVRLRAVWRLHRCRWCMFRMRRCKIDGYQGVLRLGT